MTLIVDEVMLREPNLLIPGKKPVGNVKIETDLTYPIYSLFPGLPTDTGRRSYDFVSGSLSDAWDSDITFGVDVHGKHIQTPNDSSWGVGIPMPLSETGGNYTFEYLFKFTDFAVNFNYFMDSETGRFICGTDDSKFTVYNATDGWVTSTTPIQNNKLIHVFYVLDGSASVWNLYVNIGGEYTEEESAGIWTAKNLGGTTRLLTRYVQQAGAATQNCRLYGFNAYNKVLSKGEIRARMYDPYQFLIPA